RLPRDQPVLHIDVPRARAGAVDAVGRADDLVVLPAVAVERFPLASALGQLAPALGRGGTATEELGRLEGRRLLRHAGARGRRRRPTGGPRHTPTRQSRTA